jgi:hypothetical protein
MTSLLTAVRILLREVARADARDASQPELALHLFEKLLEQYDRDPVCATEPERANPASEGGRPRLVVAILL